METAQGYGLHTEYIPQTNGTSGMGVVNAIEDGSVFATIVRGANFEITEEDINKIEECLDNTGLMILQWRFRRIKINMPLIWQRISSGCRVLLNAAPAAFLEEEYLKKCDIVVVNKVEASFYAKKTIDTMEKALKEVECMAKRLENIVIITMGKDGAVVSNGELTEEIPADTVNAVETTGAENSFIGGIGYAIINGMNIFEACRFATKCSAITVCRMGAPDSMPRLQELQ